MKKRNLLYIALLAIHCQAGAVSGLSPEVNQLNLNSLATLSVGENTLYLQDYIASPENIDSVTVSSPLVKVTFIRGSKTAKIQVPASMEPFVDTKLWCGNVAFSIPCRKTDKRSVLFSFNPGKKKYNEVRIAGQMNDWTISRTPALQLNKQGIYQVRLMLSPGSYLYQLKLDGEQNADPANPDKVDNGYGKFNSILHVEGRSSFYPVISGNTYTSSKIVLSSRNKVKKVFAYWQNSLIPCNSLQIKDAQIHIPIPEQALAFNRSYIRVWAVNDDGVSNDVLIPLCRGKVITDASLLTRNDKQTQIIYFLLVDRFLNGDKKNDHPLNRPDVNPKVDFMGGDLAGIDAKINEGYFERLGTNTLWISPLNQNPQGPYGYYAPAKTSFAGYHGYWPVSSSKVDFRFGTNQELKNLVADAHSAGVNVLLDYVAHHVHKEHPFYKEHPDWTTPLYLPDGSLNTERWDDQRLTTWFDTFMPTLDLSNPKVVDMMTDSAMFWLNEFKLDGFRHDACKHITEQFWRELTLKIKKANQGKSLYQIGETYGSPDLINSYLNTGMLDGQFDFNVYDIANTTFAGVGGSDLKKVRDVLNASLTIYGTHNLMGYISGNHDKPRFMALASGDLNFGEDSKVVAWTKTIGVSDSSAYSKLGLMHAFNLTIPGVPVIYYGDEIGMTGANDPDSRRMMKFENLTHREQQLKNDISRLTHLRLQDMAFTFGEFINLSNESASWVYARKYFDKEALVFINNSSESKEFQVTLPPIIQSKSFKALNGNTYQISNRVLRLSLRPLSFEVLY